MGKRHRHHGGDDDMPILSTARQKQKEEKLKRKKRKLEGEEERRAQLLGSDDGAAALLQLQEQLDSLRAVRYPDPAQRRRMALLETDINFIREHQDQHCGEEPKEDESDSSSSGDSGTEEEDVPPTASSSAWGAFFQASSGSSPPQFVVSHLAAPLSSRPSDPSTLLIPRSVRCRTAPRSLPAGATAGTNLKCESGSQTAQASPPRLGESRKGADAGDAAAMEALLDDLAGDDA